MIKKSILLIIIITLIIMLFSPTSFANNSIIIHHYYEQGNGNDEMLYNNGYEYLDGTVNWEEPGVYKTTHLNENEELVIINNHIIPKLSQSKIENKMLYQNNFNLSKEYQFCDIFYISETDYYVVCNYFEVDPEYYDQERVAILYFENYTLKWYYHYHKYSHYLKASLKDDNLIVSFNIYNENEEYKTSSCLLEINKNRSILKDKEYKGEEKTTLKNYILVNNDIYLIFDTASNLIDFKDLNPLKINNIVVLKIRYHDFMIDNYFTISSKNRIMEKASYYSNNKIIIIGKEIESRINQFIVIDLISKDINVKTLNQNINEVYYSFFIDNSYYLIIKNGNDNVIINENGKQLYKIDCTFDSLYLLKTNEMNYYFITKLNDKLQTILKINKNYKEEYNLEIDKNCKNLSIFEDHYFFTFKNNLQYDVYKFEFLEFIYENNDKKISVNGNEITVSNEKINTNKDVYGTYYNYKTYKYKSLLVVNYAIEEVVPLVINIRHHDVYYKGFALIFNGIGLLGNQEIQSGYICNDIGNYSLEITGANGQKTIYTFAIDNLVSEPHLKKEFNFKITNKEMEKQKGMSDVINNINIEEKTSFSFNIPLFLITIIVGFSTLFLVRRKIQK